MKSNAVNKYVIFSLNKTIFGLHILKTKEIVEFGKIIPVPESPPYIKGIINLRGMIVPVVDLAKKFFDVDIIKKETTGIIIIETEIDNEEIVMGLIVDNVIDVLEINNDKLDPLPKFGSKLKSEFILNVSPYNDDFILILDIEKVISNTAINVKVMDDLKLNET